MSRIKRPKYILDKMGGGGSPLLRMSLSKQKSRKKYNIYALICSYLGYYLFVICILFIWHSLAYPIWGNKKRDRGVQNRQCTPVRGSPSASISSAPFGVCGVQRPQLERCLRFSLNSIPLKLNNYIYINYLLLIFFR